MSNTPLPADRWLSALESRRGLLTGAVLIVCVAMILVTAMRNPVDYDGYWHLRMGMDWVQNGLSPWVDHYSYTFKGAPISSVPFMFQAALYGFVSLFGEQGGMIAIKVALSLFMLGCMVAWLEQIKAPVLAYVTGLILIVVAIQLRAQVRPELFSLGLMLVAAMLYARALPRQSLGTMLPIAALLLFWSNYHSPIFGYVIFFGLFVDIAVDLLKQRAPLASWYRWLGWGVLVVAVGFLRPGFVHPLLDAVGTMGQWRDHILEYAPPGYLLDSIVGTVLIAVAALTMIGLAMQRKIGLLVVTIIFVYSGASMARMVAPATVWCAAMLPWIICDWQQSSISRTTRGKTGFFVLPVVTALFILCLFTTITVTRAFMQENLISWTAFPVQLTSYFKESGRKGRIFNDYETGGYLIYHLSPDSQVFIDGRTHILYPPEHYLRYRAARHSPLAFLEEVDQHGIEYAILRANSDTAAMMTAAGWSLEFMDIKFALFQPDEGRLKHFGEVWGQPWCWSEAQGDALKEELAYIRLGAGEVRPTTAFMHYVLAYASTDDRPRFMADAAKDYNYDNAGRRFLAVRALAEGAYETTIALAGEITVREPRDDLLPAAAAIGMGDWTAAQAYLTAARAKSWRFVLGPEKSLQLGLLQEVALNAKLDPDLLQWRDDLAAELIPVGEQNAVNAQDFCINEMK